MPIIEISYDDIMNAAENASEVSLQITSDSDLKSALAKIKDECTDAHTASKALILIKVNDSYPLQMNDLTWISGFLDQRLPSDCKVTWGVAKSFEQDCNCKALILTISTR